MKEKHLSLNERQKIQIGIEEGKSFSEIGRTINKSHTTVSREILKHRTFKEANHYGRIVSASRIAPEA